MKVGLGGGISITATDRWLSEIRAGRGFIGLGGPAAVVGQQGFRGLFNLTGSAVRGLIYGAWVRKPTVGTFTMRRTTASDGNKVDAGHNLLVGGAAPVIENNEGNAAAPTGTAIGDFEVEANVLTPLTFAWLAELPAEQGLYLWNGTANEAFTAAFLWAEV